MSAILHLTSGTSVIPLMREAGIAGPIVPWEDVLHEGPVPAGLNIAAMRARRAAFLASCGWGAYDEIERGLQERDALLGEAIGGGATDRRGVGGTTYRPGGTIVPPSVLPSVPPSVWSALQPSARPLDEVVLWFEHDLYDQLQLLQILDRLPLDGAPRVTAVPDDDYLGTLPAARFQGLLAARRDVTSSERLTARDAWTAFRSSDPRAIVDVLPRVTDLRHLGPSLLRHLQQFPSMTNGLSRTEHQALEAVSSGVGRVRDVYLESHHGREEAVFMGDAGFLVHIESLWHTSRPLLRTERTAKHLSLDDEVRLTDDGRRVLDGALDRVRTCGIHRWLGGVELSGNGPVWRWDGERQTMRLA